MNKLILDANAFINDTPFDKLSETFTFITHPDVADEIKDHRTREKIASFRYPLQMRTPTAASLRIVQQFAKATGDFASLSNVDMEVIALGITIMEEEGLQAQIHYEPLKPLEFNKVKNITHSKPIQEEEQNEDEEDDGWIEVTKPTRFTRQVEQPATEVVEDVVQNVQEEKVDIESSEESGSEDDGEGWITQENMNEMLNGCGNQDDDHQKVSILTGDYAMQNVILQLGVPLLSFEGKRIKQAKRFILECHICKLLVRDSSKLFCPKCGNNSLLKVSCSLNSDGTIYLYRKKNFQINLRGTQYNISRKTSKKDMPIITSQDQLLMRGIQQKIHRQKQQDDSRYSKLLKKYDNGIGFDDVDTKMRKRQPKIKIGFGHLNPNDNGDMRKIKNRRQ